MNEDLIIRIANIRSWSDYKKEVPKIVEELNGPFFRGQGNKFREAGSTQCGWRLEPSFYRSPIKSHPHYIQWLKTVMGDHECKIRIESVIKRSIDIENEDDRLTVTGILRHMRFPTPLLDWTKDPFIAAYFAFSSIKSTSNKVTIFIFDKTAWETCPNDLTSRGCIVNLEELNHEIKRQTAQNSVFVYCRNSDMYREIVGDEYEGAEYFIGQCSLGIDERERVLTDLREMGITKEKLFPDEEYLQGLRQNFNFIYEKYIGR